MPKRGERGFLFFPPGKCSFFLFGPKLCREWYDTVKSASISLAWEKGKKLLQCTFRDKLFLLFAGIREGVQLAHFILRLPPKKSHFPSFLAHIKCIQAQFYNSRFCKEGKWGWEEEEKHSSSSPAHFFFLPRHAFSHMTESGKKQVSFRDKVQSFPFLSFFLSGKRRVGRVMV